MSIAQVLLELLRPRLDFSSVDWLSGALEQTEAPLHVPRLRSFYARVGRKLGSAPVKLALDEVAALREEAGLWPFSGWGADECGRAALLAKALEVAPADSHVCVVEGLYHRGTIRERQAVLRILAWLPDPVRFAPLAEQACRSHVPTIFEAVALANPYPARYLPPRVFEKMVAKAIASRTSPERILGLASRVSAERGRPVLTHPAGAWMAAPSVAPLP